MKFFHALLLALLIVSCTVKPQLTHVVFLDLKPAANLEEVVAEIQKLKAIREIGHLEVGTFENLDDPRALSQFELVIVEKFENREDYEVYQNHEIHLALRAYLSEHLAGPPVTYDYMVD